MPIVPVGHDALKALLRGNGRVALANRASTANGVHILAAAIVRHDPAGEIRNQVAWDLDLAPGEAEAFDLTNPTDQPFSGIELLMTLFSPDKYGLRDVYLVSPPDSAPSRQWEAGVRLETDAAEEREFFVPESSGLVAYLRAIT